MPAASHSFAVFMVVIAVTAAWGDEPRDVLGDSLPPGAKARLGTSRGVGWQWRDMTLLPPDYKRFATVARDKGVLVCDLETGRVLHRLAHERGGDNNLVAVSADGKRLVTWQHGVMTVWEIASGRQVLAFKPDPDGPSTARAGEHSLVSLSADGKMLALGGWPRQPKKDAKKEDLSSEVAATVWDVEKNERIARVVVTQRGVLVPLLSRDGKTLVTWNHDRFTWVPPKREPGEPVVAPPPRPSPDPARFLRVWEVPTGKLVTTLRMGTRVPMSVAISPEGSEVAVSTLDGFIERWETRTGKPKTSLRGRDDRWLNLAFSPDGQTLAAAGAHGAVRRWTTADSRLLGETDVPIDSSLVPGFVDNDRLVVWVGSNSQSVLAWEVPSGKLISPRHEQGTVFAIGFADGGKEVVTSGPGERLLRWDAATGKSIGSVLLQTQLPPGADPWSTPPATFISPDATRAFGAVDSFPPIQSAVYDPKTGERLLTFPPPHAKASTQYLACADLSRIVVLSVPNDPKAQQAACEVWDVPARRKLKELALPVFNDLGDQLIVPRTVTGGWKAALSPNGACLLTFGITQPPPRIPGKPRVLPHLLITGWDLTTGKKLSVVSTTAEVMSVNTDLAFTLGVADNTAAVLRDQRGSIKAFDYERGWLGFEIDKPRQPTISIPPVFSPDGTKFAVPVVEKDGTFGARVYDWPRGKILHTFSGHVAPVSCLAFSPDCKTLASGSYDTTVLLWDLAVGGK